LLQAWRAYADDNDGRLVGSHYDSANVSLREQWVQEPQDEDGNGIGYYGASLEEKLWGIKRGLLFSYLKNTEVYHCPADMAYQEHVYNSTTEYGRWRSYSLSGGMNGKNFGSEGSPVYYGGVTPCTRYYHIDDPASKYVVVPDWYSNLGWLVGMWVVGSGSDIYDAVWSSVPAMFHGPKTNIGFADGHVETHKWVNQSTIDKWEAEPTAVTPPLSGYEDIEYMQAGYAIME